MIYLKSAAQIAAMRKAGALLYDVLIKVRHAVKPGMSTGELDGIAEKLIRDKGAIPSFLGYRGFPATLCTSLNEQVVHGIPSDTVVLREGDILSVDCGLILNGWQSDSAFTVGVGNISPEKQALIDVTEECFFLGARRAVNGGRLQDISHAVQTHAESHGYGIVRELVGHGIGRDMHEEPSVPNFGRAGQGVRLREGMTIAVEPMIAMRDPAVTELSDGWTVVTIDKSPCAHYEHTLCINDRGLPELLSYPGYVFTEEERK
ncbi:MAG: type I methionyl aminopeptidase [Clostridiales bacterium]|nr:type I methionyl aminopeptidase [Clostridiales bacterium]